MPPTPCPERLRKLIERLNEQSGDEAHVLRNVLRAIQNKLAAKARSPVDGSEVTVTTTLSSAA